MVSLRKNIFYSSILTAANYVFPLLTYPYVSRVLGVSNIGICNFVDSLINYFSIVSILGIGTVGIREISRVKHDKKHLESTFSKIFTIHTISTTIALAALIIAIYSIPKLYENRDLMWIGALKLVSSYLLIDWLYKGLEEFKYVTDRTIFIKCLYVISVFIFIKTPQDTGLYYLLLSLTITANAIVNILHGKRFVNFRFSISGSHTLLKAIIILGIYNLLTSMYTTFNVVFLGFACNDTEVGYYVTSHKIYKIILSLFTAATGVMMPRLSSLIAENRHTEFRILLKRSFLVLWTIFLPISILIELFAPEIINLIAGAGYEGAILPLRIIAPLLLIIGSEQIIITQGLMPLKKDKAILTNSVAGAAVGVTLNILLVPEHGAIGSAIAWVCSECTVLASGSYFFIKAMNGIRHVNHKETI